MNDPRTHEESLARWARSVLRQLPPRQAPPGLAALVLAAVEREQVVAWHQQPWRMWSSRARLLTAVLLGGVFAAVWWFLLPQADAVGATASQAAAAHFEVIRPFTAFSTLIASIGKALVLVLRTLNPWVLASLIGILAALWSTALGLGTACWRMARVGPQDS